MAALVSHGSSPLSRGIPLLPIERKIRVGIIPALAGNTMPSRLATSGVRDHPRSRGEYPPTRPTEQSAHGSSPLSRGIHLRGMRLRTSMRIIPALAGNTIRCSQPAPRDWDHPRSRGEYRTDESWICRYSGSSPLSRGIRTDGVIPILTGRIIPALAGNTV